MQVFDDQQARVLPTLALDDTGEDPLPTPAPGTAVHRLVDRPQLRRLRQVEHVVKKDGVVTGDERGGQRCNRCSTRRLAGGRQVEAEQAARQRPNRIAAGAAAEIEHQRGNGMEPVFLCRPRTRAPSPPRR